VLGLPIFCSITANQYSRRQDGVVIDVQTVRRRQLPPRFGVL